MLYVWNNLMNIAYLFPGFEGDSQTVSRGMMRSLIPMAEGQQIDCSILKKPWNKYFIT